ncbi:MAG: Ldh family oxidoreductase [Rhodospirillales bacterium]|nr:Ldh family oxidoreductase [Rhodospirillales bacterium]
MHAVFDVAATTDFARAALIRAGLAAEMAQVIAERLIEADLYGHDTHGLALLAPYIAEIEAGRMTIAGAPEVLRAKGAAVLWDGRRLPGVWTTHLAVAEACRRARDLGLASVVVKNGHHIACLAAYLEAPARAGMVVMILSSDPSVRAVAPFGGTTQVMTPNPLAIGIPTDGDPILIDISASITTVGQCERARKGSGALAGKWLIGPDGQATDQVAVLGAGGALLPMGGTDHGHKGYGIGLMIEALTQGLGGFGRAEAPSQWGGSVQVLAFDPEAFGGIDAFTRETGWLAAACRASAVAPGAAPVRLPGEAALARKRDAAGRVRLAPGIVSALEGLGARHGLSLPGRQ